jgi:hypothetical protein
MSKQINKAYNHRYNMKYDPVVNVLKSGTTMRYQEETSAISSSTTFEKLNPPNSKSLVSKRILLETYIKIPYQSGAVNTGVKTDAAKGFLQDIRFRKNFLNRQIRNAYLMLNGETFSHQIEKTVDLYDQTGEDYNERYYAGLHNSGNADMVADMSKLTLPAGIVDTDTNISTTARRYEFVLFKVTKIREAAVKEEGFLVFKVSEYLRHYMTDFNNLNCDDKQAWYNITSFKLNLDINSTLTLDNILSSSAGTEIVLGKEGDNINVLPSFCDATGNDAVQNITARVFFETPSLEAETSLLPRFDQSVFYQNLNPVFRTPKTVSLTGIPTFSGLLEAITSPFGDPVEVQLDNFQLNSIPEYIVVRAFVKSKTRAEPDVHAHIDRCSILLGNDDSNLRSFTGIELWKMSAKNGLKYSYQQQKPALTANATGLHNVGGMGSLLIIHSSDLNLPANISSGVSLNTNLQINLTLRGNHTGAQAKDYEVLVTLMERELLEIKSGSASRSKNLISADELMATPPKDKALTYSGGSDYKMKIGGFKIGGRMKGGATMSLSDLADTVF